MAAQADAAEDEQFGEARGDELPAALADRRSRRERLRRCREELEREGTGAQASYQANLAWRAEWEAEHGRKLTGRKPTPPDPESLAKRRMNTTDPDTRMMKRIGGRSVQGYNVQVVASPKQIIQRSSRDHPTRSLPRLVVGELQRPELATPLRPLACRTSRSKLVVRN